MTPIEKEIAEKFKKAFPIGGLSSEAFNAANRGENISEVKQNAIITFLIQEIALAHQQWREEERGVAKTKSEGQDELWCEFWRCLSCKNSSIPAGSKYCSSCGRLLTPPQEKGQTKIKE